MRHAMGAHNTYAGSHCVPKPLCSHAETNRPQGSLPGPHGGCNTARSKLRSSFRVGKGPEAKQGHSAFDFRPTLGVLCLCDL